MAADPAILFRTAEIMAAPVNDTTPAEKRKRLITCHGTGDVVVLTSCMVISEDAGIHSVGGALLIRPTASLLFVLQMVGRATWPGSGNHCLLYTSPSPRDATLSRMPSSA